ncbi:MAG: DinB family protein [Pyrinomonadaceae bacterium]
MQRPEPNEYDPYYIGYISQIKDGEDLLTVMEAQPSELRSLVSDLPEERGTHAYAEGKWTIKELLSHIIDGERMFAYRMLRVSRGDETPIEGFEQDGYIENSNANNRPFAELLEEFDLQRRSTVLLLRNLSDESAARMGTANNVRISARAIAYIMAGHVRHHENILKERYLV